MLSFSKNPSRIEQIGNQSIYIFNDLGENIDMKTVQSFGEEWTAFSQFSDEEIRTAGNQYFDIVKEDWIRDKKVLDVGCGTGRWSKYIASKAKYVEAVDPSKAVYSAAYLLKDNLNVRISQAGVDTLPFEDESFDFVFSLGVLHHIPHTSDALKKCVGKLKTNGYFLVYLYYNFEQRGSVFKSVFWLSNLIRFFVSKLPPTFKRWICNFLAVSIYTPLILVSKLFDKLGLLKFSNKIPLAYYKNHSWNIIKNDALDRFGTPLEQRFSRDEIRTMMESAGLTDVTISENEPYWHAIGRKK